MEQRLIRAIYDLPQERMFAQAMRQGLEEGRYEEVLKMLRDQLDVAPTVQDFINQTSAEVYASLLDTL